MSEPLTSPEFKDQFCALLKEMQTAGSYIESQQPIDPDYVSDLDDIERQASLEGESAYDNEEASGKKALIPFLQLISGVHIDENTKTLALDAPNHLNISSDSLFADLTQNNDLQLVEVSIGFGERPSINFSRIVGWRGLGVKLRFDENANLSGATITKIKVIGDFSPYLHEPMGRIELNSNGDIISSHGSMRGYDKGHVDLIHLLANVTNPQGLDQKIDFKTIIPISK
jgi:hypothetical protein